MKDSLYIKTQLDNELSTLYTVSEEGKKVHMARINLLTWIYNFGELRTEKELRTKLRNVEEELLALNFQANPDITTTKTIKERLNILKDII